MVEVSENSIVMTIYNNDDEDNESDGNDSGHYE
jgi:hypothetical protein